MTVLHTQRGSLTTGAETGMGEPPAKATTVMVCAPGVDGAVKVKENSETPTLAKLMYRCARGCGAAAVPALATNEVGVEPLTGTSGVVPITEPSTWQCSMSWRQHGPWCWAPSIAPCSSHTQAVHTNSSQSCFA